MEGLPEVSVEWLDKPVSSYEEAIRMLLITFDQQLERKGWDQPPLLGVVEGTTFNHHGSFCISVPELFEEFYVSFESALTELANSVFVAELNGEPEYQEFLNSGVSKGFQGWLCSVEVAHYPDPDGPFDPSTEHRITIFVDIDNERFAVSRKRGSTEASEMTQDIPLISRQLSILTAASVMSLVRRNLDSDD